MADNNHPFTRMLGLAALALLIQACAPGDDEAAQTWDPPLSLTAPASEPSPTAIVPMPAPESDAGSACEADWVCGASAYCSEQSQRCAPRCQGETCVGPSFARDNDQWVSDGQRVCFADDSEVEGEYALRLWDGSSAQASTLTRALGARALLLDATYCYFHAAEALRRAPLNGGCVELVQQMGAPPTSIWRDGEHVAWTTGAGTQELTQRIASAQNAKPEAAPAALASRPPANQDAALTVQLAGRLLYRDRAEGRLVALPAGHEPQR